MNLVDRIKNILLKPKEEWPVITDETASTADLYKNYIIYLAAIGPIASFIGMSLVGISMPFMGTVRVPIGTGLASAVVSYVLGLVGVYILALIIDYLAPTFAAQKDLNRALKLACYSYTAVWLAGIFSLIPALAVLSILGLYSIYLLYTGIPVLMKAPQEKSMAYTAAVMIISIIIFIIISWISHAFVSYPVAGTHLPGVTNEALQKTQEAATKMEEAAKQMQETMAKTGQMTKEQAEQMEAAAKKMREELMKQTAPRND